MAHREKKTLIHKVLNTIKKYQLIEAGDILVLGVSGGPDSITMLDILLKIKQEKQIAFDFVVAHVNHMIREEANEDEEFVKKYCIKNNIQFFSKSIDVQKIANTNKISTEEAGRYVRYAFFDEVLEKMHGTKIAIAHNKNDKVETIIMNELRGCGIQGLKGIEPIRGKYIRPLIECERKEIEEYCKENNIEPRIDKTNFENVYTRNKIRNIVIPYIKQEFNPNIIETMDRFSNIVTEQEEYIQKQAEIVYEKILVEENIAFQQNCVNMKNIVNKKDKSCEETEETIESMKKGTEEITTQKRNEEIPQNINEQEYIILDLKGFNKQEKVIKSNIILYTITRLFNTTKGIEKIHIEDIIKLCANNIGNKFLMPNKNLKVFVKNGKIKFSKEV